MFSYCRSIKAHLSASGPVIDTVEVFRNARLEPVLDEDRKANVSRVSGFIVVIRTWTSSRLQQQ